LEKKLILVEKWESLETGGKFLDGFGLIIGRF